MGEDVREGLPFFDCHKTVQAVPIHGIELRRDGSAVIAFDIRELQENVADADLASHFYTEPGYDKRFEGDEEDMGYYVRYEDGFESWSPTEAFEKGYSRKST